MKKLNKHFLLTTVSVKDAWILSAVVILLVFNPFYLYQKINLFELGLYLPGVDSVLKGQIPFRDFFYLRGPMDLYIPAFFMKIFGEHVATLSTYFYVGTIITLLSCVWLAREVMGSKIFVWALIPVLVARTFPRVVYTFWGGMRFAWGIIAILCIVKFIKSKRLSWAVAAGVLTALAILTSVDVGACIAGSIGAVLVLMAMYEKSQEYIRALVIVILSCIMVTVPYLVYLHLQGAFFPFIDTVWHVVTRLMHVVTITDPIPSNLQEASLALFNPKHANFHQMTPVYCYVAFSIYMIRRVYHRKLSSVDWAAIAVMLYSFFIYLSCFKNLWGNIFEMALQPEKIILFFLLERLFFYLKDEKCWTKFAYFIVTAVVISSFIFSIGRLQKRFFSMQWLTRTLSGKNTDKIMPLAGQSTECLNLERAKNMTVPQDQANEFIQLEIFLNAHTAISDPVLMYPELATLHFIFNRPYIGRFPLVTLTWLKEEWYQEWIGQLQTVAPRYAVILRDVPDSFKKEMLSTKENRIKFNAVMNYIKDNYSKISETASYDIYQYVSRHKP